MVLVDERDERLALVQEPLRIMALARAKMAGWLPIPKCAGKPLPVTGLKPDELPNGALGLAQLGPRARRACSNLDRQLAGGGAFYILAGVEQPA
jgi:hypothetical protein